jgi:hypothetical protein
MLRVTAHVENVWAVLAELEAGTVGIRLKFKVVGRPTGNLIRRPLVQAQ